MNRNRNIVKTEIAGIRIPEELANEIDQIILDSKEFTNKPDFIVYAMRFTDEWFFNLLLERLETAHQKENLWKKIPIHEDEPKEEKERIKKINDEESTKTRWKMASELPDRVSRSIEIIWNEYRKYMGNSELILLRVPTAWMDKNYEFHESISNLQDFARISIINYIEFISIRSYLKRTIDAIDGMWMDTDKLSEEEMQKLKGYKNRFLKYYWPSDKDCGR